MMFAVPWLFDHGRAVAWTLAGVTVFLVLHHYDYISTTMSLEQISLGSNREDSQGFINERVCRH